MNQAADVNCVLFQFTYNCHSKLYGLVVLSLLTGIQLIKWFINGTCNTLRAITHFNYSRIDAKRRRISFNLNVLGFLEKIILHM